MRLRNVRVHGYKARFAPDGRRIALYGGDSESRFIRILDIDGKNEQTILREGVTETPNGLCWSPDGRRLAVVMFDYKLAGDGKSLGTNFDEHDFRLELIDADGKNRRRLKLQEKPGQRINYFSGHPDWR